jgi:cytochrome c556
MKKRKLALIIASVIFGPALLAATVSSQIEARQANFKQIGRANKALNDELKKSAPSMSVIRTNALALEKASLRVAQNLPKGSGKESGVKTAALPTIWSQPAEYKKRAANFQNAAKVLRLSAASGNIAKVRSGMAAVGPTCKGCHDTFKEKN